jgi:di/tricarboxylate transporter
VHTGIAEARLKGGDALLVEISTQRLPALRASREFVVVSEHGPLAARPRRAVRALAVVAAVVAAAATGVLPISVAAVAGAVALVLLGCLTLEEAYAALDLRVVVLLGGILPLGIALERTGLAALAAGRLVEAAGPLGPVAVIAVIYGLTSALTEVMSNNATAVLMVPLALGVAGTLGVDPRPLLLAVAFGASASFMTPVGYQTNTLVYGPGAYRFVDYLRVGTPLNLLFWALASVLIPVFWPL